MNEQNLDKHQFERVITDLSPRRKEILLKLLEGQTDEEIGKSLGNIQPGTVRTQISNIYKAFNFESLSQGRSKREELLSLCARYKPVLMGKAYGNLKLPPVESQCYQAIEQPCALIRIKAPQKMGKTYLMSKILDYSSSLNYKKVQLNFLLADREVLNNSEQLALWFCDSVSKKLKLSEQELESFWQGNSSINDKCTNYFEEFILNNIDLPLVLALDNVDRLFEHEEVALDFFSMLRAWHEEGMRTHTWEKLRLIMAYATEVYINLDYNLSPFNVGIPIEIPEFEAEKIQKLAVEQGVNWDNSQVESLMEMIGGHPYLVQEAISYFKLYPDTDMKDFLDTACTDQGIYYNHFLELFDALENQNTSEEDRPRLTKIMKTIVEAKASKPIKVSPKESFQLDSLGLVRRKGNGIEPRCKLYREYFRERLNF